METARTDVSFRGERSKKFLKVSKSATAFQKHYDGEVQEWSARGKPVIWTNVGVPTEIMHAMGIPIMYTINWSALLAAKQMAPPHLQVLNDHGYSRDLCRYCALPLGYFFRSDPDKGQWGGMPKPTALVMDGSDDPIVRIWELMSDKLNAPLYIWDHTRIAEPPTGPFLGDSGRYRGLQLSRNLEA